MAFINTCWMSLGKTQKKIRRGKGTKRNRGRSKNKRTNNVTLVPREVPKSTRAMLGKDAKDFLPSFQVARGKKGKTLRQEVQISKEATDLGETRLSLRKVSAEPRGPYP